MSKRELIDRIQYLNPTAKSIFLAQFNEGDLNDYLGHLQGLKLSPRFLSFGGGRATLPAPAARNLPHTESPAGRVQLSEQAVLAF